MRRLVVLGATSAIVTATLRRFARDGDRFFLVARSKEKTETVAADLKTRGAAEVHSLNLDLAADESWTTVREAAVKALGEIDLVYLGYGTLTDQDRAETDLPYAFEQIRNNFTSAVGHCSVWASYFEGKKAGHLAVITSVAGDRGRKRNYLYGSSKAALSVFLGGLRNRLAASNVAVTDIRPGFVDTPMTGHLKKGPLFASPESVGEVIYRRICSRSDVVYVPWFWGGIMFVIRSIPERIFKRLSL